MKHTRVLVLAVFLALLTYGNIAVVSSVAAASPQPSPAATSSRFCWQSLPIISWFIKPEDNPCLTERDGVSEPSEPSFFSKLFSWLNLGSQDITEVTQITVVSPSPGPAVETITTQLGTTPVQQVTTIIQNPAVAPLAYTAGSGITIAGTEISNTGLVSLSAGNGISVDGNQVTNTDQGSAQNIFKKFTVTGQNTITASSNNDTLTFAAGSGISLGTNASTNTLTITNIGGGAPNGWSQSGSVISLLDDTDAVGVGTTAALGKLAIVGSTDQLQLVVRANSSQTSNLLELQNNAGSTLSYFTSAGSLALPSNGLTVGSNQLVVASGRVGIGTATPGVALDVNGSARLAANQTLTLSSNTPTTGTISRLITLRAGSQYDRPWISSLDHNGRHVAAMGIHGVDIGDDTDQRRWEIKTVAAAGGSMPEVMLTRFAIDYDRDLADVIFSRIRTVGIHNNYGERISMVHQMRNSADTASVRLGEWSSDLGANDSTVMAIDPQTLNDTRDVNFRMFRDTNTSGQRRFVLMQGNGTATETFVVNAATGHIRNFTNAEAVHLGDGTNVSAYINYQSNRSMTGYDGSYAVLQGGLSKGVKLNVNSSSFGAGTALTILPTGEVGIGTTNPSALLSVGTGSPFQVNSSGAIAAATGLTSSGTITLSGLNTAGGVVVTNGSGVLSTVAGSAGECLISNGSSAPTWVSCGSAGSNWRIFEGAIFPHNSSVDFLVGGTSSASAKFAVINVNTGTPVASISGLLTINNSAARIQATQYRMLSIGGNATGTISLQPNNSQGRVGINTTAPLAELDIFHASSPELRLSKSADSYFVFEKRSAAGAQIADVALTGEALLDLDPITTDGTSKSSVRLFRNVNTSDTGTGFAIYSADGTAGIQSFFGAKTNSYFNALGGNFGVGTSNPQSLLHVAGNARVTGQLIMSDTSGSSPRIYNTSNASLHYMVDNNSFHQFLDSDSVNLMTLYGSTHTTNPSRVSIGTTASYGKLTIAGNIATSLEGDIFSQRDGFDDATYPIIARYWTNHGTYGGGTFIFGNGINAYVSVERPGGTNVQRFRALADTTYFSGEVGIGVDNPDHLIELSGGAYSDGASWENASDRELKTQFSDVSPEVILAKLDGLTITEWSYISEGVNVRHIGPVAQDFYTTFGVGKNDKAISTIDPAGIALVGVKGLHARVKQLDALVQQGQVAGVQSTPMPSPVVGVTEAAVEASFWKQIELFLSQNIVFKNMVSFVSNVVFRGRVLFETSPEFNRDTAGIAVIAEGADQVTVNFAQAYPRPPQMNATMIASDGDNESALLHQDIKFVVTNVSATGFVIKLNKPAPTEVQFSWLAILVTDPQTTVGANQVISPASSPTPLPSASASPSPAPEVSPSPAPSPSAEPSPVSEVVSENSTDNE